MVGFRGPHPVGILVGFLADVLFADPRRGHPVAGFGWCATGLETLTYRDSRAAGVAHTYLEFGSYFNTWYKRNALKMWTGWPTFPMVFRDGVLLGGHKEVKALIARQAI